jgi:hypothetical protein
VDYRGHERYQEENAGSQGCVEDDDPYCLLVVCAVRPAVDKAIGIVPVTRNRLIGQNPQDSKEGDGGEAGRAEAVQKQANPNGQDKTGYDQGQGEFWSDHPDAGAMIAQVELTPLLPPLFSQRSLDQPPVPAEERGVNAVPRNLLYRLTALWTTDRIHAWRLSCSVPISKVGCHPSGRNK